MVDVVSDVVVVVVVVLDCGLAPRKPYDSNHIQPASVASSLPAPNECVLCI